MGQKTLAKPLKFAIEGRTTETSVDATLVLTQRELVVTGLYTSDDFSRATYRPVSRKEAVCFRFSIGVDGTIKFQLSQRHRPLGEFPSGRVVHHNIPGNWMELKVDRAKIPEMLREILYKYSEPRLKDKNLDRILGIGPPTLGDAIGASNLRELSPHRLRDILRGRKTFGFDARIFPRQEDRLADMP